MEKEKSTKAVEHLKEIEYNTDQTNSNTSNTSDGIDKIVILLEKQNLLLERLIMKIDQ
jgi:hypothetical protein